MTICVYGASSNEIDEIYIEAAQQLGAEMARRGISMVFGGGAQGLMGAAARGMSSENGEIIGVAPSFFNVDGILYDKCADFIYTQTMRERKQIMEERSDAFIMTPGGIGTFEEFFEILTLKQLGRHNKPIAVYNINGYFDSFVELMENAVRERFMRRDSIKLFAAFDNCAEMLDYIDSYDEKQMSAEQLKFLK